MKSVKILFILFFAVTVIWFRNGAKAQTPSSVDHIDTYSTQTFQGVTYDRVLFNVFIYDWAQNIYPACDISVAYADGTSETFKVLPSTSFKFQKPTIAALVSILCDGKQATVRYDGIAVYYNGQILPFQGDANHIYIATTPSPSIIPTPTAAPSLTPTPLPTMTPTLTPTATPSLSPTATPTSIPCTRNKKRVCR